MGSERKAWDLYGVMGGSCSYCCCRCCGDCLPVWQRTWVIDLVSEDATDDVAIHSDLFDPAFLHLLNELGVVQLAGLTGSGEVVHHCDQNGRDDQPQDQVLCHVVQLATL